MLSSVDSHQVHLWRTTNANNVPSPNCGNQLRSQRSVGRFDQSNDHEADSFAQSAHAPCSTRNFGVSLADQFDSHTDDGADHNLAAVFNSTPRPVFARPITKLLIICERSPPSPAGVNAKWFRSP